jgi:hypothetical protein
MAVTRLMNSFVEPRRGVVGAEDPGAGGALGSLQRGGGVANRRLVMDAGSSA